MNTPPHWLTRKSPPRLAQTLLRLFYQLLLITCLLTGLGFLGKYSWVVDLTSHFRMQYFAFQVLGLLVLVLARARFRWMVPVVLCAGLNAGFLLPYFVSPMEKATPASGKTVRVLHMNVLKYGNDFKGAAQRIRQDNPDILSLQELNPKWQQALESTGVLKRFPYRRVRKQSEIGIYTSLPVINDEVIAAGPGQMAALHTRVRVDGRPVSVIIMHPPAPVNVAYAVKQRRLFLAMEQVYQAGDHIENRSMIIGDLNTTPFSWSYRRFVDHTGMQNFRTGRGYLPSWPSFAPLLQIPIDHVLLSKGWRVRSARVGPAIGSDHLPVLVDLQLEE